MLGALAYAKEPRNHGKLVVTIIPDFGERYLQTQLFEPFCYEGSAPAGVPGSAGGPRLAASSP